jgi:hypothetical protein
MTDDDIKNILDLNEKGSCAPDDIFVCCDCFFTCFNFIDTLTLIGSYLYGSRSE